MKSIVCITFTFIVLQFSIAQGNWEKFELGNWGVISIPNTMEIQSGNYKKILDYSKRHFSVNAERIIFQQKGLNEGDNLNTYARVIIRTDFASEDFPDLASIEITSQDIADLNKMYELQLYEVANNPTYPMKIIKWNGVKIVTINGNKAINYSYIRQMDGNSKTYSEIYIFWKGNRQYTLNIEYRLNESFKWKSDLDKCVQSFKLK